MSCADIARDARIDRDVSRIYRWRDKGKWRDLKKRSSLISEQTEALEVGAPFDVSLSELDDDEAVVALVMQGLGVEWDLDKPMGQQEVEKVLTAIVKKLLGRALQDLISGRVKYTDPYQVHQLLGLVMHENRLSHGKPTEIHDHNVEVRHILPSDDNLAIAEGLRRLKMIAERRRTRAELGSGEPEVVEAEVVKEVEVVADDSSPDGA